MNLAQPLLRPVAMRRRSSVVILASLLALAACTEETTVDITGAPSTDGKTDAFSRCTGRAFTAPARTGFSRTSSRVIALTGARHRAQDVIVPPHTVTSFAAKFAYGPTWKDLEGERVKVYIDNCGGWVDLGTVTTDGDGYATLPVNVLLGAGQYELRFVARGDASQARSTLWVLPAGTHVTVTDIDGTLTTSDTELWKQLFDGSYVPVAQGSAQALTRAHANRGDVVIYLTGRPSWLIDQTRSWLVDRGFARGPVHLADSNAEVLPIDASVGAYKEAWLEELEAYGYRIDLAYGNATTDIHAYTGAGIAPSRQWIIGTNAGAEGTHAVGASWAARTAEVQALPPVVQPF